MPGLKNTTKKMSKRIVAAERKNKIAISSVMNGQTESVVFARIEKNLGSGGFSLLMNDNTVGIGLTRRTTCRVSDKCIVICSAADHNASAKVQSYEIVGVLAPHEAQKLWKDKVLSKHLYAFADEEDDDIFDHEESEDDELDVDAI